MAKSKSVRVVTVILLASLIIGCNCKRPDRPEKQEKSASNKKTVITKR